MLLFLIMLTIITINGQYLLNTYDGQCPLIREWRLKGTLYLRLCEEKERLIKQNRILEENYKEQIRQLNDGLAEKIEALSRTNFRLKLMTDLDSMKVKDCQWLLDKNYRIKSGVYNITVAEIGVVTYCDMDTQSGGWTVIFQRNDSAPMGSTWEQYKDGFGSLSGNYWIGNENIHKLTDKGRSELYVVLEDLYGSSFWAKYTNFTVSSESENYKISYDVQSYNETEGTDDSYIGDFRFSGNIVSFSTYDNDNDDASDNCAEINKGGWWYDYCNGTHLTGEGFGWRISGSWKGLRTAIMMVRPTVTDIANSSIIYS